MLGFSLRSKNEIKFLWPGGGLECTNRITKTKIWGFIFLIIRELGISEFVSFMIVMEFDFLAFKQPFQSILRLMQVAATYY